MLASLKKHKLVPVIAIDKAEDALKLGEVFQKTGLGVAEITFRTAAAGKAIALIKKEFPDLLVGAGTLLTEDQLKEAADCGSDFFISPGFNPPMVEIAQKMNLLHLPGVTNPGQVEQAMWMGLKALKFFPAEAAGGIPMLKAFSAVYPQVEFMPTGGISDKNILSYLSLKNVFGCGGSWIVQKEDISEGRWELMEEKITSALNLIEKGELQ